jgi:superfamily II DNA/RNA helicase
VTRNKKQALLDAVTKNGCQRVLVFCSSIQSCRIAENVLKRFDRKGKRYDVLAYHAAVDGFTMHRNLAQFVQPLLKKPQVMICSDRASRGLDFDRIAVDHVVLFDFPR